MYVSLAPMHSVCSCSKQFMHGQMQGVLVSLCEIASLVFTVYAVCMELQHETNRRHGKSPDVVLGPLAQLGCLVWG